MMALVAENSMNVAQLDVTTVYLNGVLQERIYMEILDQIEKGLRIIVQTESKDSRIRK